MQTMVVPSHHLASEASVITVIGFLTHRVKKRGDHEWEAARTRLRRGTPLLPWPSVEEAGKRM